MNIDKIVLPEYPVFLAPMEDVTDPSFRHICKHFGADMMYTEFVASEALIRDVKKTFKKLEVSDYERPIGIQLYGHNIDAMVDAAKIATEANPDLIDINYGCPVKKIATRGAGAGMLRDIPKMIKMTEEIVKATNLPVTVKTRLGWDSDELIIEDIAERLQDTGIKALTIHGRTRAQMYKGIADWTLIGKVKNNQRIKIPIIGNGDIDSPQKAKEAFDKYGVDGIMVGRATYGRPYIFKEIKYFLEHGEEMRPLTLKEKVELAKMHFTKSIEYKGERRGVYEMRRHLVSYFKGIPNFKEMRLKLVTTNEPEKVIELIDFILKNYNN
ncbi:MAG: tRNA dihydrouridine synthase DusB [Bacteroidales bacterium]|nr:tRNA dihydrouridine synthase DusB [Bacteroidales bacterium]MBN2756799.1 tRNA dihydrouridine synthase DusB [Bacteroidales bacterium]